MPVHFIRAIIKQLILFYLLHITYLRYYVMYTTTLYGDIYFVIINIAIDDTLFKNLNGYNNYVEI